MKRFRCPSCGKRFKSAAKQKRFALPKLPECPKCGDYAGDDDEVQRRRPVAWVWRKSASAVRGCLRKARWCALQPFRPWLSAIGWLSGWGKRTAEASTGALEAYTEHMAAYAKLREYVGKFPVKGFETATDSMALYRGWAADRGDHIDETKVGQVMRRLQERINREGGFLLEGKESEAVYSSLLQEDPPEPMPTPKRLDFNIHPWPSIQTEAKAPCPKCGKKPMVLEKIEYAPPPDTTKTRHYRCSCGVSATTLQCGDGHEQVEEWEWDRWAAHSGGVAEYNGEQWKFHDPIRVETDSGHMEVRPRFNEPNPPHFGIEDKPWRPKVGEWVWGEKNTGGVAQPGRVLNAKALGYKGCYKCEWADGTTANCDAFAGQLCRPLALSEVETAEQAKQFIGRECVFSLSPGGGGPAPRKGTIGGGWSKDPIGSPRVNVNAPGGMAYWVPVSLISLEEA